MTDTPNLTPDAATITDAALRLHYDDITTRDSLIDLATFFADDLPIRDALIRAIDIDLNDMLHNANLDFYLPLDDLDALTDEQHIALSDHLLDATDPAMIANALIARCLDTTFPI